MTERLESQWAFKEWAVVCSALASGQQQILLRKGGIHEEYGLFQPEHDRFWLYPTRFHQSPTELNPETHELIEAVREREPVTGTISFREYVRVEAVVHLTQEKQLDAIEGYHVLSSETIRQRFHYRQPGLYVLAVETYCLNNPISVPELETFAGCKTWVELPKPLQATGDSVKSPANLRELFVQFQ